MSASRSLPTEAIDGWPEIFNEVTLTTLPLIYINTVLIDFTDGKIWEIDITPTTKKKMQNFEKSLAEILLSYKDNIKSVNVKINTKKIRCDVEKSIKKMLNKLKL